MKYYLVVSYDGTDFNGWQAQKREGVRTVQETLEGAAEKIFGRVTPITASGRTDAGVHALGQVCSFGAETTIPPEKIADCFNLLLPSDVKVVKSGRAAEDFDACRSAKKKTYVYSLYFSPRENPLLSRYAVRVGKTPEAEAMRACAAAFVGTHDFKAFCAADSSAKTSVRTVYEVRIEKNARLFGETLDVFVTGNGFLDNMVRTMVGTLLEGGFGRKTAADIAAILQNPDREKTGKTMPAKGLCLFSVAYDEKVFTKFS